MRAIERLLDSNTHCVSQLHLGKIERLLELTTDNLKLSRIAIFTNRLLEPVRKMIGQDITTTLDLIVIERLNDVRASTYGTYKDSAHLL